MKTRLLFGLLLANLVFTSCSRETSYGDPVEKTDVILKNLRSFLEYRQRYVRMYEDFKPLDTASKPLAKEHFLKLIATGEYIPLRLKSVDTATYYKLYKLEASVSTEIRTTVKYWGLEEQANYEMEGKALPNFTFVDMEGKTYTPQNTRGKILVVKCWFIGCLPCVKEMPVLNEIKRQYEHRDDVLFVSVCWDKKNKVESFLKRKQFDYAVVPDQYEYLVDRLHLSGYPTHFVINKKGLISKKNTDYQAMAYSLKKEAIL